jgi:hypothetical protein
MMMVMMMTIIIIIVIMTYCDVGYDELDNDYDIE